MSCAVALFLLMLWAFGDDTRRLYISQMNDRGYQGCAVMCAVAVFEGAVFLAAASCRLVFSSFVRFFAVLCLVGLTCTDASSHHHIWMFIYAVIIGLLVTVTSVADLLPGRTRPFGLVVLLLAIAAVLLIGFYSPTAQKALVVVFILVEMINLNVSFPLGVARRYLRLVRSCRRGVRGMRAAGWASAAPCTVQPAR